MHAHNTMTHVENPANGETEPAMSQVPQSFMLEDGTPDYLRLILASRVYDIVKETPVTLAPKLSTTLGANVYLKREDLQPVFSFKIRGAYNLMAHLSEDQRWKGIISCSAGNHAQGVAYAARHLGIPATIVMPENTPSIKHENVSRLGAKVILYGRDFDEAREESNRLCKVHDLISVPPFDDPYVIAGQGTVGVEILRQINLDELEAVFVGVGGGGLISGVGEYLKRVAPHVKIIGVETFDADAMKKALEAHERIPLKEVGLFSDGTAVRLVGKETFRICQKVVDEIVLVNTDEICAAIKDVYGDTRSIVEPAGALSIAGLKSYLRKNPPPEGKLRSYCAVCSGSNMNFDRLRFVAERAELGEKREAFMSVIIPEERGSFRRLHSIIAPRSITEFSYRYSDSKRAYIYISIHVQDLEQEIVEICENLKANNMIGEDISDNEMAKLHARYLVGGRAKVDNERLYQFEFPERPGALDHFLQLFNPEWNITLFHYRNNGADVAKILAGISIPPNDISRFNEFLDKLGYPWIDETTNKVYQNFLRG